VRLCDKARAVSGTRLSSGEPEIAPELASDLVDLHEEGPTPPGSSPATLGVWELAWPTILSFFTQAAVRWVSFAMVGQLGADALAAVGIGNQFFWLVQSLATLAPTGIVAVLSRAVGAGDPKLADASLRQGLWLGFAVGIVSTLALLPLAHAAIALYGVGGNVVTLGGDYLWWTLVGNVPMVLAIVYGAALRAAGDTHTPLWIGVLANVVNVFLCWALIYGNAGFPALGVSGAGIASTASMSLQLPILWWLWRSSRLRLKPSGASSRPDRALMTRLMRVGYPAAIEGLIFQVGLLAFMRVLGGYETAAIAAYNVGAQILSLSFLPGIGFATAAATLVGQHLGEGKPELAERSGYRSMWGAIVSMSVLGALTIATAPMLARTFSNDPHVIDLTVDFIWTLGAVQPLMAIEYTIAGALRGAGDTRFPLFAIFAGLFLCRLLPAAIAAYVFQARVQVVWSMLVLDYALKASLLLWRYRRGRWKTLEV
jgi:putative MATE family efflux protein